MSFLLTSNAEILAMSIKRKESAFEADQLYVLAIEMCVVCTEIIFSNTVENSTLNTRR
jgi:hypothetical protein